MGCTASVPERTNESPYARLYDTPLTSHWRSHFSVFSPVEACVLYLEKKALGENAKHQNYLMHTASSQEFARLEDYLLENVERRRNNHVNVTSSGESGRDGRDNVEVRAGVGVGAGVGASSSVILSGLDQFSVEVVVLWLRKFFSRIPDALFCFDRYDQFIGAVQHLEQVSPIISDSASDYFDKLFYFQALIATLPVGHFVVADRIIGLLHRMCNPNGESKIDLHNTVAIFAGDILRPRFREKDNQVRLIKSAAEQDCLAFMVRNYARIFKVNAWRELNALHERELKKETDLKAKREELHKMKLSEVVVKTKIAHHQFRKNVLVRHFLAWHAKIGSQRAVSDKYTQLEEMAQRLRRGSEREAKLETALKAATENLRLSVLAGVPINTSASVSRMSRDSPAAPNWTKNICSGEGGRGPAINQF